MAQLWGIKAQCRRSGGHITVVGSFVADITGDADINVVQACCLSHTVDAGHSLIRYPLIEVLLYVGTAA